jgi:hypothetical protein
MLTVSCESVNKRGGLFDEDVKEDKRDKLRERGKSVPLKKAWAGGHDAKVKDK